MNLLPAITVNYASIEPDDVNFFPVIDLQPK